ncbi:MAG: hypothetical protein ABA06_00845 [Parcubacteria bacterium C7867-001]|nr:MAG: hypothetical protein ABA06_00845 [Parcubacteria bacterium C7867-001]
MKDLVERLRAKPEHIRRRITLGTSVGVTGVVAIAWLIALVTSSPLLLPTTSVNLANTGPQFPNLLGGAAAAFGSPEANSLTIEDGAASSTLDRSETDTRTVIPF